MHRLASIAPLARIASASVGSVIALGPLMLGSDVTEVLPQSGTVWLMVAGLAIGSALVPQLIYVLCSPIVGASRSAVLGSVELPTMFAAGIIAFGERLTLPQAIGCMLILAAIILTQSRVTRNLSSTIARR